MKRLDEMERDYYAAKAKEGWWSGVVFSLGVPVLLVVLLACLGGIAYSLLSVLR